MKFGKTITKVTDLSDPEWAPFWLNYKNLKKKLKIVCKEVTGEEAAAYTALTENENSNESLKKFSGEVAFFRALWGELNKCTNFFLNAEQQFVVRKARLLEGWRLLLVPGTISDGDPHARLTAACVKFYRDLLLLENFSIMNYTAFSKILKKHDKLCRFRTRESFMKNVVNHAPFAQYKNIIAMVQDIENLFTEISKYSECKYSEEEQLFIDTVRSINREATKMKEAEINDTNSSSAGSSSIPTVPANSLLLSPPPALESSILTAIPVVKEVPSIVKEEEKEGESLPQQPPRKRQCTSK